jgi:hypothetical protein
MKHVEVILVAICALYAPAFVFAAAESICNPCVDGPEMFRHKERVSAPPIEVISADDLQGITDPFAVGSWVRVPEGTWTATARQRDEVSSGIQEFVKQQAKEQNLKLPRWSSYSFQYQEQVDGNQKIIFVNAFCIAPPGYVRQRFVVVLDGGPCFFQVKFDPQTKQFSQLRFNGIG